MSLRNLVNGTSPKFVDATVSAAPKIDMNATNVVTSCIMERGINGHVCLPILRTDQLKRINL